MKYSFHQNPDGEAPPNTIAVFNAEEGSPSFGQPATPEQIDALLILLNTPGAFEEHEEECEP